MSRGPHSSAGHALYYDTPAPNRWDRARFENYRRSSSQHHHPHHPHARHPSPTERDIDIRISDKRRASPPPPSPPLQPSRSMRGPPVAVLDERERYWERDRFGGPSEQPRRRDINVYWEEPTHAEISSRALAPYRPAPRDEYYPSPPPAHQHMVMVPARPRFVRRQSSLDTFDRRPSRDYDDHWRPPAAYVPVPAPLPPRRHDDWDDLRYRDERDLSPGWEEEYRDVRVRRRGGVKARSRGRSVASSASSSDSGKTAGTEKTAVEEKKEDKKEEDKKPEEEKKEEEKKEEEKKPEPLGKKGKTRMPKRLVHKAAVEEMGLPYEEEEHFIVVQRALEKEHIDEVIKKSEAHKETTIVTYKYTEEIKEEPAPAPAESAPPPPAPAPPAPAPVEETTAVAVVDTTRRSDRALRDEIRALELEREALRLERRADRKLLEVERVRDERDYEWELVERSRPVEVLRVEKDRRGRKGPDPRAVAFAMATLT